jgi:FixJ family two-component response regulator
MNESQGSVFIVDDDESVRNALSRLVRSVGLNAISCESANEFLKHSETEGPACAVLDVRMPGTSGLDLQAEMVNNGIALPLIFISGYGTVPMSVRAMKAGAIDFIEKPFDDQLLIDAINIAIKKDKKHRESETNNRSAAARFESLTPREAKIYGFIAAGFLNKQIAMELGNSEKTIKVHRGRIMTKMGAKNLPGLLRKAQTLGLLTPAESQM